VADPKDELPSHLRHINKRDDETQRLVKKLRADLPDEAPVKRRGVLTASDDRSGMPYQREIDAFTERLEEPWVTYGASRKQFLKTQLSQARRKDPQTVPEILKRENALLDEAEREWREIDQARKKASRKPSLDEKPGLMERLRWWWYRFSHKGWFENGRPSGLLFDHFALHVKGWAAEFIPVVSFITDQLYNRDFFLPEGKSSSNAKAYNLLTLLSRDHMGRAMAKITSVDASSAQLGEKVRELDDFARIFLLIALDESAPALILSTMKDIQARIADGASLHPSSQALLTLPASEYEKASRAMLQFLEGDSKAHGTLPRLLAIYSFLFDRQIEAEELGAFLELGDGVPVRFKQLTPAARAVNDKLWRELKTEQRRLEDQERQYGALDAELEFAERLIQTQLQDATPRDHKLFDEDPFSWFNHHILFFLVIYEDLISGRQRVTLMEGGGAGQPLLMQMPPESAKSLAAFPIKQDLLGKFKKPESLDAAEYRRLIFDDQNEHGKAHQKSVEYVRKLNGRIALHFAHLFEKEIYRLRDNEFDRLGMHLDLDTLKSRVVPCFGADRNSVVGDSGAPAPVCLQFHDKFGKSIVYEPDTLFALLKLGKALLTYIAWELHDPQLVTRLESRKALGARKGEIDGQIKLLEDPDQGTVEGPVLGEG
jgi:hypothetical protein